MSDTDIPAQAAGTTVYYIVTAEDNDAATTTTNEMSYGVVNAVADIATLRAGAQDGTVYLLTGEAILTYQEDYRGRKFLQDATAGIVIDDNSGVITTVYNVYDGITGIAGTLSEYNNLLQFVPTADPGAASSSGNSVTPVVATIPDLNTNIDDYESELVKVEDVSFTVQENFANGTNYDITDGSNTMVFRSHFYDVDYIGTAIPATAVNITGLLIEYQGTAQIVARNLADFEDATNINEISDKIIISPNPASHYIQIRNAGDLGSLSIVNMLGETVKRVNIESATSEINIEDLSNGIYFIRFNDGNGEIVNKTFVKQ
jgi:hypothetical protein